MVMKPAERRKKIMVIGAGPAGLETARVAAERGHEVAIYDRENQIGGLLNMAAFIKGTHIDDLTRLTKYYHTQLKKLGVAIQLGKEVDADTIIRESPDAVILALGGKPADLPIPVKPGAKVVTTEQLKGRVKKLINLLGPLFMHRLTKIFLPLGKKVVIIGSDLAGVEAAEFLAKRGREVTIVDEDKRLGEGMLIHWLVRFRRWMKTKNIAAYNGVKYEEITPEGITITTKEGERKTINADTIMIITRYQKNDALRQALQGKVPELHVIGDAKSDQPGYIIGAIHDGARLGLTL
jgi:2,4-dienoyl-CoA reductase (NADPH2)